MNQGLSITRKRSLLRHTLEKLISRIKGREYSFDPEISLGTLVSVAMRRLVWLIRGNLKSLLLRQRLCSVFVAPGVTLRNARMIRFGRRDHARTRRHRGWSVASRRRNWR